MYLMIRYILSQRMNLKRRLSSIFWAFMLVETEK